MLSINSEEFSVSDDYARMLEQILPTCKSEKHLLSIAGATHPSFSDVFLIIPGRGEYSLLIPQSCLAHHSRRLDRPHCAPVSGVSEDDGGDRSLPWLRRRCRVDPMGHVQARNGVAGETLEANRAAGRSVLPDRVDGIVNAVSLVLYLASMLRIATVDTLVSLRMYSYTHASLFLAFYVRTKEARLGKGWIFKKCGRTGAG